MVGIRYTGTDGKTTSFSAASPSDAITRLRGIKGYNGNVMDSAAAGLAEAFAARKKNATRVAELNASRSARPLTGGLPSVGTVAYGSGTASHVDAVSDIRTDGEGNIVAVKRSEYIASDGSIAAVGASGTKNIGKIGVSSVMKDENGSEMGEVVVGIRYDEETHQLIEKIGKIKISGSFISIVNAGERVITTAVEETVVS